MNTTKYERGMLCATDCIIHPVMYLCAFKHVGVVICDDSKSVRYDCMNTMHQPQIDIRFIGSDNYLAIQKKEGRNNNTHQT